MRMCGTRIRILVFMLFCSGTIFSQECNLPSCFDNECGPVNVGFSPAGGVQFCENTPITFNNTSSTTDFDFFIVDWADGNVDTIYNYQDLTHTYLIPDTALCEYPSGLIPFEVCFQGIKSCTEGISCASGGYDFALLVRPRAIINAPSQGCENEPITFNSIGCHEEEYLWTFSDGNTSDEASPNITYSQPGSYAVTLTVTNECGTDTDVRNFTIIGIPEADASISPIPTDNKICVGQVLTFTDLSNQWSNTSWQIIPTGDQNWCFTDTSMNLNSEVISIEFKEDREYTIRLLAENICGNDVWEETIEVLDGPTVTLQPGPSFCESGLYTPQVSYTGEIESYLWTFDGGTPNTSTNPNPSDIEYLSEGIFDVSLVVTSACGDFSTNTTVTVNSMVPVDITAPTQICQGSSPDTFIVNQPDGTWSGTGIGSDTGVFDPSGLDGTYTITYTIEAGACSSSDMIEILVTPSATVTTSNPTVCIDGDSIQLTADPVGGTWTGDHVDANGLFDVNSSGEGEFDNTYLFTDINGCDVEAISLVSVNPLPQISILDTTIICAGGGQVDLESISNFSTTISGGDVSYIIDGSTVDNLYDISLAMGSYDLEAIYTIGPCEVTTQGILSVIMPPVLIVSSDTSLCINQGTYALSSNIPGGMWTGPGITTDGIIDLTIAGGGSHTYTYTILPNTTCETTETTIITITDPGANLDAGPNLFICENEFSSFTFSDFSPINGTWSGEAIGSTNGTINIDDLVIDSLYTYQYCVENDQFEDCQACDTRTFIVRPLPEPMFEFLGGVCIGETFTLINNTVNGDSYEWDFGDGNTSTQDEPNHSYTVSGNYTIILKATSQYGCMKSISLPIYVSRPPTVDFSINVDEGCAPLPILIENNSFGDDISYQWVINGDTSTVETPTDIIFDGVQTDTIIEIRLDVINSCGTVTQTENVLVHPYPIVKIDSDVDEGCSPLTIEFANKTIGNPETYLWDLGNGNTSSDSIPPTQTYTTTDSTVTVYTVSLTSTNECGTGYGEFDITVYPPDVKAFIGIDTLMVCQYDTFQVQSQSTAGSIITWSVFDSDGNLVDGYNVENPEIVIAEPGRFMIVLYASRCGTDSDTTFIDVLPAPEIEFDIPPFICLGDSLLLTTNSSGLSETVWDFGDGNTSDQSSTYHIFDSVGIYDIALTGYSSINNCPFTLVKSIEVLGLPVSSFEPDRYSGCRPLNITFDNTSLLGNSYSWDWGDGTTGSNEENPSHTFLETGTFTVSLRTFDEFGCFADTTIVNIIVHDLPISDFVTDADQYCQFYDSIRLTNNSIDAASALWVIEDDTVDMIAPVLSTSSSGFIDISLIAINGFGCQDISSQVVDVLPSPIAEISPSDTVGCQPLRVQFDNASLSATDFVWSFDNSDVSSDVNWEYLFTDAGIQAVQLVAINENGCPNDTATVNIDVLNKPQADFDFVKDQICGVPNTVSFTNLSTNNIIDNEWSFGVNGANSQLTNPEFEYESDEDFIVQLQVENNVGCLDTVEKTVPIWLQPEAIFTVDRTEYCEGEPITITNESQNTIFYTWEIENQIDILDYDPEISFNQSGNYSITLIAEYNEYCKDTLSINNYFQIYDIPTADFSFEVDLDDNVLGDVDFENLSLDYTSILWDLGDGNFSTEEEFSHEYDINRDIFVTLYAENDNNGNYICIDSITKPVAPEWQTKFFAPNAVSPNYGDEGTNLFTPKGIGIASYEINIYSPWGKTVWSSTAIEDNQPSESWNGKINNTGSDVPMGAYSWLAEVTFVNGNKKIYQGTVTVLR